MTGRAHDIVALVDVHADRVEYACSCGTTGYASRAYRGEDLRRKAAGHHRFHVRYRTGKIPGSPLYVSVKV